MKRFFTKVLTLLITVILLLENIPPVVKTSAYNADSDRVIVSLGDSFSSGEGIEPFYGQFKFTINKVADEDWLAHRSRNSWPGRLTLKGVNGTMAENRNTHWFFAAVSGAETKHLKNKQTKSYNRIYSIIEEQVSLPAQLDIFETLNEKNLKADYVTITIGGNDAGFTDVITAAAMENSTYLKPGKLKKQLVQATAKFLTYNASIDNDKVYMSDIEFAESGSIYNDLCNAYEDIHAVAGEQANIIVAGYPKLINNATSVFFNKDEVNMINNAIILFNYGIEKLIKRYREEENMPIHFVTVEKAFEGHEAYSPIPAINPILPAPNDEDLDDRGIKILNKKGEIALGINPSAYSMHPNFMGAAIYAECVQNTINRLEDEKQTDNMDSTTTQQSTDTSSDSFYNEQFYQNQQFNMQKGGYYPDGHFVYDENSVYYHAYTSEFGKWLKSADDIFALKGDGYGTITNTSTDSAQINICFSGAWATSDTHIYYIRYGELCRLEKSQKTNAKNIDSWSPDYVGFTDEVLHKGTDMQFFVLSKNFIFVLDGSELICLNHDGSNKRVIATGINPTLDWQNEPVFTMYTISENLYYVSDGQLYCYYSSPNTVYSLCKINEGIELMCCSGNTLYFTKKELYATDVLDDQYTTTVYKFTEGDTKLTKYMSFVTFNTGTIYVDPLGAVYIANTHGGGTPVIKFVDGKEEAHSDLAFNMNCDMTIYNNQIVGFDFMFEKMITAHTF